MGRTIPFTKTYFDDEEREAVLAALDTGAIGGNGAHSTLFEEMLEESLSVKHALFTTSCSHALELGAMALDLAPDDEVIVPSFTFVTTASSIVRQGARPVFVDIDERTWNMDIAHMRSCLTPRTKAILPVHYAGQACKMDEIMGFAQQHGLYVMEDAAQGLGASYKQKSLGTIGHIGCLSFHVTKNVVCGEGGAFLTNDDGIAFRAEIIREKGTNRSQFLRGEVDKYTWVDLGSSFIPSDLLAAIAVAQFRKMDQINRMRRRAWEFYQQGLQDLEQSGDLILPFIDPEAQINYHIYAFRMADSSRRDDVIGALKQRGVGATFHYIPLHSSPYATKRWGYRAEDLPVTELVAASLIRLPLFPELTREDLAYIIETVYEVVKKD
jgi:dTDP-4-amino-4,6-dideoxygalactose transaminase